MKHYVKYLFVASIFLTTIFDSNAQPNQIEPKEITQSHPRILLFKGEETNLVNAIKVDPTWLMLHNAIIQESDRIVTVAPIKRIQIGRRLLDKSREALKRLFYLSYAYRTTKDQKYLIRAENEMLVIAGFSDWNPSHFLDVAEMTMAMSIGYDWLFDQLSQTSKDSIQKAIIEKGIEPSLDSKNNSWLKVEHNWNQVCNAGMSYGAMAIYERDPKLATMIIKRAIASMAIPMKDYGPDGIYPEGYGYWGYGTTFNVLFLSALEKIYGTDFGMTNAPGFLQTAGFMESMTGTTGKPFNYSDAGGNGSFNPAMFWLANKVKDPSLLWVEKSYLKTGRENNLVRERILPAIMLWKGNILTKDIIPPSTKAWIGKGKNPMALMRTSWTDSNAIYIAAKGGSASINHAHMDIGSFIMDADGERWAMDFGMQDYESLESKGVKLWGRTQNSERWDVFRLNNYAHNTLTIDSQLQVVEGHASIIHENKDPNFMQVTFDLSSVYKNQLASSNRGIAIVNNNHVVVRDEIQTLNHETKVRWTMLTPAEVEIVGPTTALLKKGGKTLTLKVSGAKNITMKTWTTIPPRDYDAPNPGTILVGFEAVIPADKKVNFDILLIPGSTSNNKIPKVKALASW
ncbi:MAG: heparinase II/III domain-containing protein [Sediminibacterium sp.]|jgi:hypothetical protein